MNKERYILPLCACPLALASLASGQTFQNVTTPAGLGGHFVTTGDDHGPGAACGDYNGDGWVDLYLSEAFGGGGKLYKNVESATAPGGRSFELDTGAGAYDPRESTGAVFIDIDNDGDQDLYVANFEDRNTLLRNELIPLGKAVFVDITDLTDPTPEDPPGDQQEGLGIGMDQLGNALHKTLGVCFADIDRDGRVDLYVANHNGFLADGTGMRAGERDVLYRQQADGTFLDISDSAGVPGWDCDLGGGDTAYQLYSSSNAAIFCDLNNDRWPDLYVTNKIGGPLDRDAIYLNRGASAAGEWLGFQAVAADLDLGDASNAAMGVSVADIDKDGDLDVYITDISSGGNPGQNDLWRNDLIENEGIFDMSLLAEAPAVFSWGTWFGDIDNDGDSDLHVATEQFYVDHMYRNDDGTFTDVSASSGIQQNLDSRGDVWLDYDKDGWIDFLVMNIFSAPTLFRNTSSETLDRNYVCFALQGTAPKTTREALGTRVEIFADFDGDSVLGPNERDLREFIRGGSNCASSNEGVLHFGVGAATRAIAKVTWPSGETEVYSDVQVNTRLLLVEPSSTTDTQAPTIALRQPSELMIVREPGSLTIMADASDDSGVTDVRFYLDGQLVGRDVVSDEDDSYDCQLRLDGLAPGPHVIRADASDAFGNVASSYSTLVIDATTPSNLALEPDLYDNDAFGSVSGESYPDGLAFNDGCRDLTLSFGESAPERTYIMPHDAPELFVDGSRLCIRGAIAQTGFEDRTGFGIVLLRDPVSSSDARIELWLISDGPVVHAGAYLPGSSSAEVEPLFSIDPNQRNAEFGLFLTRNGTKLTMEVERSEAGLRRTLGVFDAAGAGIDLDQYQRAGLCIRGEGSASTSSEVDVVVNELVVTHPQIGSPCLDAAGWNAQLGLLDQPLAGTHDFAVTLSGALGGSIAALLLGPHEDSILPFDLGLLGAPGCTLLVIPQFNFVRAVSGSGPGNGNAMVPLPVPLNPALIGSNFGAQWLVLAPGVNPLGAIYSSAAQLRIR